MYDEPTNIFFNLKIHGITHVTHKRDKITFMLHTHISPVGAHICCTPSSLTSIIKCICCVVLVQHTLSPTFVRWRVWWTYHTIRIFCDICIIHRITHIWEKMCAAYMWITLGHTNDVYLLIFVQIRNRRSPIQNKLVVTWGWAVEPSEFLEIFQTIPRLQTFTTSRILNSALTTRTWRPTTQAILTFRAINVIQKWFFVTLWINMLVTIEF